MADRWTADLAGAAQAAHDTAPPPEPADPADYDDGDADADT